MAARTSPSRLAPGGANAAACLQTVANVLHPPLAQFVLTRCKVHQSTRHASIDVGQFNTATLSKASLSSLLKCIVQCWSAWFKDCDPDLCKTANEMLRYRGLPPQEQNAHSVAAVDVVVKIAALMDASDDVLMRMADEIAPWVPQLPDLKHVHHHCMIALRSRRDPLTLLGQGDAMFQCQQFLAAVHYYSKVLALDPDQPTAYGSRAAAYNHVNEFARAREDAEEALKRDPTNIKVYRTLAKALIGLEQYCDAQRIALKGLQLCTNDEGLVVRLREIHLKLVEQIEAVCFLTSNPHVNVQKNRKIDSKECLVVGLNFLYGRATAARDALKAERYLLLAAEQGLAEAQYELGKLYREGSKTSAMPRDLKKAVSCWEAAADRGHQRSRLALGRHFWEEWKWSGKEHSLVKAKVHLQQAADNGLAEAQLAFVQLYHESCERLGLGKDLHIIKFYLEKAARQHNAEAQYDLACLLLNQVKDSNAGFQWARAAAEQRLPKAMLLTGDLYAFGHGCVLSDPHTAMMLMGEANKTLKLCDEDKEVEFFQERVSLASKVCHYEREWKLRVDGMSIEDRVQRLHSAEAEERAVPHEDIAKRASAGSLTAQMLVCSSRLERKASESWRSGSFDTAVMQLRLAITATWSRTTWPSSEVQRIVSFARKVLQRQTQDIDKREEHVRVDAAVVVGYFAWLGQHKIEDSESLDLAFWAELAQRYPSVADFHFHMACIYHQQQDYRAAMQAYDRALRVQTMPQWLFARAKCVVKLPLTSLEEQIGAFNAFVARSPPDEKNVPDAYYALGNLFYLNEDYLMASTCKELGNLTDRPTVRLSCFPAVKEDDPEKQTLHVRFLQPKLILWLRKHGSPFGNVKRCEFCMASTFVRQFARHKMYQCPKRTVFCGTCGTRIKAEKMPAHMQSHNPEAQSPKPSPSRRRLRASMRRPLNTPPSAKKLAGSSSSNPFAV